MFFKMTTFFSQHMLIFINVFLNINTENNMFLSLEWLQGFIHSVMTGLGSEQTQVGRSCVLAQAAEQE